MKRVDILCHPRPAQANGEKEAGRIQVKEIGRKKRRNALVLISISSVKIKEVKR